MWRSFKEKMRQSALGRDRYVRRSRPSVLDSWGHGEGERAFRKSALEECVCLVV